MKKGLFITLEGGEGSGKSTQIRMLSEYFESKGKNVTVTFDPGGSEYAAEIRKLVLSGNKSSKIDPIVDLLLYAAARRDLIISKIQPAIDKGDIIISDRFMDSTTVYQGLKNSGKDIVTIGKIIKTPIPDLTILLDIDPEIGIKRSLKRLNDNSIDESRWENEKLDLHQTVRTRYLEIASLDVNRFLVINVENNSPKDTFDIIIENMKERFNI